MEECKSLDDVHTRLLLTRALFLNGENERASIELQKLKEIGGLTPDLTRVLSVLDKKIQLELTNLSRVGTSINDSAYLGASPKPAQAQAQA